MADDSKSKPPGVPLDFLAKVENLIRGTGHTALLIVRTVLFAPRFFFSRSTPPTEAIAQAVATGRALPPLLYLTLMAPFVPIAMKLLNSMLDGNDPASRLRESLRQLAAQDAAALAWQVAPAVLGIWLVAEACGWLLARMTGRPRPEVSQALLYCYAMLFGLINVFIGLALMSRFNVDQETQLRAVMVLALYLVLAWLGAAVAGLLGWQLMQDTRRTLSTRARTLQRAAMALALVLPGASFVSTALVTLPETDRPDLAQRIADALLPAVQLNEEHLRHTIFPQVIYCRLQSPQVLRCSLLLQPFKEGVLLAVAMSDPRLTLQRAVKLPKDASRAQREGLRQPLRIDWLWPEFGRGPWMKLGGTEPSPVELSVTVEAMCQSLGQIGARAEELGKVAMRFDLLAVSPKSGQFEAAPEPYRVSLGIPDLVLPVLRESCSQLAPALPKSDPTPK